MDINISWKMQVVADQLAAMHGRAFADAFLEDYVKAKRTQSEQRSSQLLAVPTAQSGGVEHSITAIKLAPVDAAP
ncbi:hypothetical protein ACHMW6_25655 [Pseudoduganella sp. UC29_106]|uniref:hypothetical protein n=1 Tax=Pseudoduganella sp. UC29_106 TaxID=3374553 RepID=UPI0037568992